MAHGDVEIRTADARMARQRWRVAGVVLLAAAVGGAIAGLPDALPNGRVAAAPSTVVTSPPGSAVAVSTTVATVPAAGGTSTTSTVPSSSTTSAPALVSRSAVRVIVVNAGRRSGLAAEGADVLSAAGYRFVITADAATEEDASVVLYAPGFEREARRAALDLGLDATATTAWADHPIEGVNPVGADVVAVLAGEAP